MTELLENSDNTNADTGVSESPANEATISLAAVQALADALQKIESYTPTVWVDNESPDIDAAHLNKAEQAIMRVTTAMNSAVDVIKDLQSQVNTTNNNLSKRFAINKTENTYNTISDFPTTGSGFGVNTKNFTLYTGFVIPAYSRICFMNYGDSPDAALSAISPSGDIYSAFRNGGTWQNGKISASKSDLGVTEYNAGKSISISGKLSDIGAWLQTNGVTSRWMAVRANPTGSDGYFGGSTFCILWQCSSVNYGWCILMSDSSKMVVFGRNSEGWHWYAPSLTEVS